VSSATSALVARLLGWFQGQHQLPAWFEAAEADFGDVVAVLQAYRVVDFAAPQAQAPQCVLDDAPVADHGGRAVVEDPCGCGVHGDEPVDRSVHGDERDRSDQRPGQGSDVADENLAGDPTRDTQREGRIALRPEVQVRAADPSQR
jgi:hypothetical protein